MYGRMVSLIGLEGLVGLIVELKAVVTVYLSLFPLFLLDGVGTVDSCRTMLEVVDVMKFEKKLEKTCPGDLGQIRMSTCPRVILQHDLLLVGAILS